jgi:hypothetical protein
MPKIEKKEFLVGLGMGDMLGALDNGHETWRFNVETKMQSCFWLLNQSIFSHFKDH